jgi:peptidoglycan/LPS O-acetylase OafA/YrhL
MRFNNIQILRFAAATAVVMYHAYRYTRESLWQTPLTRVFDYRFGWGVELFFAISGFVVSHSLAQSPPGRFLAFRLIRIYPAFWLAVAIVVFAGFAFSAQPVDAPSVRALSLLPWGPVTYPLGGVEWSLVYELFFYALLAAIALVPRKNAREWAMLAWLVAIVAAALVAPGRATKFLPTASTILFSAFNLPFILGVLAYLVQPHHATASPAARHPGPLGLVAAIRTRPSGCNWPSAVSFCLPGSVAADMCAAGGVGEQSPREAW